MPPASAPAPRIDLSQRLRRHRVFGLLPDDARRALLPHWQVGAVADGQPVALDDQLGWVLEGQLALTLRGAEDRPLLVGPGELFGAGGVPFGPSEGWQLEARGDCTLAFLPGAELAALCAACPLVTARLRPPALETASGPANPGSEPHLGLMNRPAGQLVKRPPVTLPPSASIADTARLMSEQRVSSVLLLERDLLFGLVTDRDLRNRVLAAGLDPQLPVHQIATLAPLTIGAAQPAFEALLLMARHNIHHLPVMDGHRVAGMITATDLAEQHSTSAVYLVGEAHKQTTVEGLARVSRRVKQLQANLAAAHASAQSTGALITAVTDAITVRLLYLAEASLGPPPVEYAWVAAGSQGRSEQTARSDQDNCLVLDDRYDEPRDGAYFTALAEEVNRGLDQCGYVFCPGDMMARTAAWRQPAARWREYFRRWIDEPDSKALMLTSVFFDLRCIGGQPALLDAVRREALERSRGNRLFLAHLVGNALTHRPPLSLFGGISTTRHGNARDAVDLKHQGIVPVVDLARVYALAGGHEAVNTFQRLEIAARSREITEQSARELSEALEFMAGLRIRHQARQTAAGQVPDNFLPLSTISNFERRQLKDAFGVVQTLQSVLAQRYR